MLKPVNDGIFEAIFFLEDQFVSRQMRYSEFESLIDSNASFSGFSDIEVTAVYIEIAANLTPTALVFFKLYFDESGLADPEWNVPLRRLARISGSGPDLGGGPLKLACRSQCAISWHQRDLWDPDMSPAGNDFQVIRRELAANKLGFKNNSQDTNPLFDDDDDIPVLTTAVRTPASHISDYDETDFIEEQAKEHRNKLARLLKAQRLRIKTLNSQHEAELEEVTRQSRIEIQGYKNKVRELEQTVQHHKVLNEQIKGKLQKRNNQFLNLQEEIASYKKKVSLLEQELRDALPAHEFDNLKQRMEGEMTILKEQLERRAAELNFRDEKEEHLKAEIFALNERLKTAEDEDILKRLDELDIVFVVYHSGAGHITLNLKDVRRYMENPTAFVAEKCGVSEDNFKLWLKHNETPQCDICKKTINRISQPAEFVAGRSNRCEDHYID
jgi:hypothetical protein